MTVINIQKKNWQKYNILGMTINATLSANSVDGRLVEFKVRFTANSRRAEEILFPNVVLIITDNYCHRFNSKSLLLLSVLLSCHHR